MEARQWNLLRLLDRALASLEHLIEIAEKMMRRLAELLTAV
jgi:hypothetical protein